MSSIWTSNKGEWSEAYTFLRLLTNPIISAADDYLEMKPGKYYVVKGLTLTTDNETFLVRPMESKYCFSETSTGVTNEEISDALPRILNEISEGDRAFSSPTTQNIFERMGLSKFKAASSQKVDIELELPSLGGGQDAKLGFSIKSMLGSPSTLFNASSTTNIRFSFEPEDLDPRSLVELKYHELRRHLINKPIKFEGFELDIFKDNLEFFGIDFPQKLASVVLSAHLGSGTRALSEAITIWAADNGGQLAADKFTFQMKNFLRATALGMRPGTPWKGDLEGYGGYIIVKPTGDLTCLHLENDDDFRSYLLNHTRLDFPKSSLFSASFVEHARLNFSVNFQIRFIK